MNMNAMKGVKRKRKSEPTSDNLKQAIKKKRVSFSTSFETRIIGTKEEFNKSTNNLPGIDLDQLEEQKPRKSILKKTPLKPRVLKRKVSLSKEDSVDSNSINAKPPSPKVTKPPPSKSKDNKKAGNKKKLLTQSKPQKFAFKKRVLKVRKSTKEILKTLNKKERREFIRQLEAKNKPNFDLVRQAKLFWETIRSSKAPADEKEESIKKLMELCNGKMANLVYTHGTSRVLQCLLKLKKPAIRQAIFEELKPEILGMAKSRYAKYFVAKMLKYGSKEQRDEVINALKGNYVRLFKAAYSAELLDAIYGEWATAEQYHAIITEFYGPEFQLLQSELNHPTRTDIGAIVSKNPEKGQIILKNLEAILETAVQKIPTLKLSITHRILLDYLTHCSEEQRKSMIDSLKDQLPEICHTREGSRAALMCIWHANPKERKAIVKSFKGLTIRSCQDSFARRVLFGIFDSVDDTVLVNKIITQEIANNIADVIYNKNGVWVLHYLVHPRDQRVIGKGLYEMLKSGDATRKTKKEPAIRYAELFNCVRSALLDFMKANMREMISNKISSVLILDTLEVHAPTDPFERNIPEADLHACFRAITEIAADEFIPHALGGPSHIVQGGCSRFVFRKLLQSDPRRLEGSKLSDFLADLPPESLASWTGMDCGCYTLVEMLKSGSAKAKEALKTALNENSLKNSSLNGAAKLLTELTQEGPMESKTAESPTKLPQGKMNAAGKRTLKMGNKKNPKSWNR